MALSLRLATFFELVTSRVPAGARVLEVGCGDGSLALELDRAGYSVLAIDPRAPDGAIFRRVRLEELDEADGFEAIVASVALHHLADLDAAVGRIAALLPPDGPLILDEFARERFVGPTRAWYFEQRRAREPELVDDFEAWSARWDDDHDDVHPFTAVHAALDARFATRLLDAGPYLFDYRLDDELEPVERELIARGELEATGVRYVGEAN